jgi:hypothetical protein
MRKLDRGTGWWLHIPALPLMINSGISSAAVDARTDLGTAVWGHRRAHVGQAFVTGNSLALHGGERAWFSGCYQSCPACTWFYWGDEHYHHFSTRRCDHSNSDHHPGTQPACHFGGASRKGSTRRCRYPKILSRQGLSIGRSVPDSGVHGISFR